MNIEMINLTYKFMKENYDYMYLKAMTELMNVKYSNATLIVGSSHALNGIDTFCFENAINCSMHTQDLYYDYLCIRKVVENSRCKTEIKKCFIVFGYYIAFQDLSRSENVRNGLLSSVYYPIFGDCHNYQGEIENNLWGRYGINDARIQCNIEQEIMNMLSCRKQYYNDFMTRRPLYDFGGAKWRDLSDDERMVYGIKRAETHNKQFNYKESYIENIEIMSDCVSFLKKNNIFPIIIIPPFTKEYCKGVSGELKNDVRKMFEKLPTDIVILDLNEKDIGINQDDFVDTDHLNGRGAYKLSEFLASSFGK